MEALSRLADLAGQRFATSADATEAFLALIADITGMPTAWVSTVHPGSLDLTIMAAHDEPCGSGVSAGDAAPLTDTYCSVVLAQEAPQPLVIDDVAEDPDFRDSAAARLFDIRAYIGVPITLSDGSVYGTLCASDPQPRHITPVQVKSLTILSRLLATQIERDREMEARARVEERYRLLAERGGGVLQVLGTDGRPEYVSPSVERVLGIPVEDFLHEYRMPGSLLVHPDDREAHEAAWNGALAGQERPVDARYRTRDRGYRWMGITFGPLTSPTGESLGIRCGFRDIDEQRQALDKLRESERLFDAFMSNSPLVAYMKDQDGRYAYVNRAFEQAFDIPARWMTGRTDADWLPPEQYVAVTRADREVIGSNRPNEVIEVANLPGHEPRYWQSYKFPFTDGNGRTYVGGVSADITERRNRDIENARMAAIIRNSQDAIYGRNRDGIVTSWNPACSRLFGYAADEMIGRTIDHLVPPEGMDELREITTRVHAGERIDSRETRRVARDGTVHDVAVSVSPIVDTDGSIIGSSTIARDITERKRLLRERQRLHEELQEELARAAEVQAQLIPQERPSLPGFTFAAACLPAREVGGDFYDWAVSPDQPGRVRVSVGDVTGKGMSAALLMATARSALRSVLDRPVDGAMTAVNRALSGDLAQSDAFVTVFHAELAADGALSYVDAGHGLGLILRRDRTVERLRRGGLPVGITPDLAYAGHADCLHPGDTLLIYSDGLPDAEPALGFDDPARVAAAIRDEPDVHRMMRRLVDLVSTGASRPDDLTLFFVHREEDVA